MLHPADVANAVTGFCTILAGVLPLLFCAWLGPQPRRWLVAYACIVVTGIPTVGYHGWGGSVLRVSDTGTNLLLAFALQLAVLGDFYAAPFRRRFALASALVNAFGVGWMIREEILGVKEKLLSLGASGGFYLGETILILDSIAVTALLYRSRGAIPDRAKPLLHATGLAFLVGLALATAANTEMAQPIWAWHALWHVVGLAGFLLLWAMNHARFGGRARNQTA